MTEKRFNCHVKFSAMPNGIMVLDYERHGDEQTVIEDISREKAHRVMDRLNELSEENEQLKQVLGNILLEVKRDITNTSQTGEVKVFINPNSFNLISDVLRKYGALKEWYE